MDIIPHKSGKARKSPNAAHSPARLFPHLALQALDKCDTIEIVLSGFCSSPAAALSGEDCHAPCGRAWHIVPDFDAPDDFHASERVWYLGAQEHPGEIYITEPYIDANTGAMCFTVSTLLSDGETVVGMDLNFDKAQESIRFFCVRLSANWGVSQLNRDADYYENHLNQWIARQESVLSLFTGLLSAEPELMDDYDKAVRLLDDMAKPPPTSPPVIWPTPTPKSPSL